MNAQNDALFLEVKTVVIGFQPIKFFCYYYFRKKVHIPLNQKPSFNSSTWFSCCGAVKTISKKDVFVRYPQKDHHAKKIIVGNQFKKLLKALYREHPKASQAINGKFQLSELKGKEEGNIFNINKIAARSETAKKETFTELSSVIHKLLENLTKKANSPQRTGKKDEKQEVEYELPEKYNFSKIAMPANIQESSFTESAGPWPPENEISAKSANSLDLLNFFSRMKTMEGVEDVDFSHQHGLHNLNGMETNGLNGIADARNVLSPGLASPMGGMNGQGQSGFLPGNSLQMQKMNLDEQRKNIEDQMTNDHAQLQMRFKPPLQQQEAAPVQSPQNDQISNVGPDLQYPIVEPSTGTIPFGLTENPLLNQAQLIYEGNPYLAMHRSLTRYRIRLPFFPPLNPRFTHRMDDEDIVDDADDRDDEEEPLRNYPVPEDEDADSEDDEEGYYDEKRG